MSKEGKDLCPKPPSLFLRDATGLVRQFTALDAFIIAAAITSPCLWGVASQIAYVISADPGADIVMSTHLGFIFSIALGVVYYLLSTCMPRSGADYVWVSRHVNSLVGSMTGWSYWISLLALTGGGAFLFSAVVIPMFLASMGYALGMSSLISAAATVSVPSTMFVISILLLLFSYFIVVVGGKFFTRFMLANFLIITISTFVAYGILAFSTHSEFVNAVNGFGGSNMTYNGLISQATSKGWSYTPISWGLTLMSIPFSILLFAGFNFGVGAAGEIRNVRRSMFWGVLGALIFAWIVDVIGLQLSVNVVGYQFLQAANNGGVWPLSAPPWMPIFISMLTQNFFLLFIVQLGFLLTYFWWVPSLALVSTRYVFAFAWDKLLPSKFADVNERFHTPVKAMILNFIVTVAFLTLATFTSYLGVFLNSVAIWSVTWFFASVAAIVLPFKKRDLAKGLPGGNWKVPLITIAGIISMILMAVNFYYSVTTPAVGPSTPGAAAVLVLIFLSGLVLYLTSYYWNKKNGIDLKLIYSEIPPE